MYAGSMWIRPYVLLTEEMQIQPLFWHHVAFWVNKPLLNTHNVEQTKYVLCTLKNIYSSRYLDTLLYMDEVNWIALEECWFIYTRNKGMRYVRITLRCTIDTGNWIELQWSENLSTLWANMRIVIALFASLITPVGVNGNSCWHLAHQTAGGTIECHSCN